VRHDPASCQPRLHVVKLVRSEALRPATALPVTLMGRDPHGDYSLSAPVPALVTSRLTLSGAGAGSGVAGVARVVLPEMPFGPLDVAVHA
jgi:hypothetical protein